MPKRYRITPQSAPANAIRNAYDRMIDVQKELLVLYEILNAPAPVFTHLNSANRLLTSAINNLLATEVITYKQLTINQNGERWTNEQ